MNQEQIPSFGWEVMRPTADGAWEGTGVTHALWIDVARTTTGPAEAARRALEAYAPAGHRVIVWDANTTNRMPLAEAEWGDDGTPVARALSDDEDDIELPDPALVRELAERVRKHYGRSLTGKATFADILAASHADGGGWPELQGLDDGDLELLLDDVQTEIG